MYIYIWIIIPDSKGGMKKNNNKMILSFFENILYGFQLSNAINWKNFGKKLIFEVTSYYLGWTGHGISSKRSLSLEYILFPVSDQFPFPERISAYLLRIFSFWIHYRSFGGSADGCIDVKWSR